MHHPLTTIVLLVATITASGQGNFTLTSNDLGGQATKEQVFTGFGCSGANKSPQLAWSNAPNGTKSFAVTMYDPDAPTGSGWWHWVAFDLPATCTGLPSGAGSPGASGLPVGAIQSMTDFGSTGYGGPCPPVGHGAHRYIITVYALGAEKLGLDAKATAPLVGFSLHQQTLAKASLLFYYGR